MERNRKQRVKHALSHRGNRAAFVAMQKESGNTITTEDGQTRAELQAAKGAVAILTIETDRRLGGIHQFRDDAVREAYELTKEINRTIGDTSLRLHRITDRIMEKAIEHISRRG